MPEEMILENVWESDEAEDSESDESIVEADESTEDIGERARRRRKSYYRPSRGVRGIALRTPEGSVRNVPFPTKLATTAETNRGLATQELARRKVEERLDRVETRIRMQQKNDSSVSGAVTLGIGGGLAVWGAVKASEQQAFTFANWASNENTQMAAVVSAAQLATTGAKLAINGRYHRSGFGIAADAFAAAQLAAFALGRLYTPMPTTPRKIHFRDSLPALADLSLDDRYVITREDKISVYDTVVNSDTGKLALMPAYPE